MALSLVALTRQAGRPRAATTPAADASLEERLIAAAAREPGSAARQELGRFYLDGGQPFSALWELWAAHRLNPAEPSINVQLAVALATGGLYAEAIAHLETLAARQPPLKEGRIQLATLYIATGQAERAVPLLRAFPELSRWSEGERLLGQVYEALGQSDRALAAYRRAWDLAPADPEAPLRLARLAFRAGDGKRARATLVKALAAAGADPRLLVLRAEVEEEETWLRRALDADPDHVPALVALGELRARQGRAQEALAVLREALGREPGEPRANMLAAELLRSVGRVAEAHAALARAYRARGLPQRAVAEYEAMARFPKRRKEAVLEMSLLLVQMQQKPLAVRWTEETLAALPQDRDLHERLVVLELLQSNRAKALERCERWLQVDPGSQRALWLKGRALADAGDLEAGVRLMEQALAAEPGNRDYQATLAEVLLRDPRPKAQARARQLLEPLAARPSSEAKTHFHLAQALLGQGEQEAARRELLRSLDRDPDVAEPYALLAQIARRTGAREQLALWAPLVRSVEERLRAEQFLARRTWRRPDYAAAYLDFARHLLRYAQLRKAEAQLEEALRLRPGWRAAKTLLLVVRRARAAV